jgi:transcriptional regulator with XRE-family HTH domain
MKDFLEINRRFREVRLKHKLTQAELAKLIGMASGSVGAIEQGLYTPNFHVLRILKKKLGVSYNYLIDGEQDQDLRELKEENERLKRIVDKLTR